MSNEIKGFETITRHRSALSQSPSVIKCLISILKYIKSIIDDDTTQTLTELVQDHISSTGILSHKTNLTDLRDPVLHVIYEALVLSNQYNGLETNMLEWLLSSPEVYELEIPVEPDVLTYGLTLQVVLDIIDKDHNRKVDVHLNTLTPRLDALYSGNVVSPILVIYPSAFSALKYRTLDYTISDNLWTLTNEWLTNNPPVDPVINFNDNEDTAIYHYRDPAFVDSTLEEYGEVDSGVYRKDMDYYSNHLTYALPSGMSQSEIDWITTTRSNINSSYHKVLDVYTRLRDKRFGIDLKLSMSKLATKTLDVLNLTGLSKSSFCLSLVPYTIGGIQYNKLIVSFDNFNEAMTYTLLDEITAIHNVIDIVVTIDKDLSSVHYAINDVWDTVSFDNSAKRFDIEPRFLFIPPKIAYPADGTIRLSHLDLYNTNLTLADAKGMIFGFKQRN